MSTDDSQANDSLEHKVNSRERGFAFMPQLAIRFLSTFLSFTPATKESGRPYHLKFSINLKYLPLPIIFIMYR